MAHLQGPDSMAEQAGALDSSSQAPQKSTVTVSYPPRSEPEPAVTSSDDDHPLSAKALITLCTLRFSSAWGERSSAFAIYLFLVLIFPSTLVPASVFGFCTTTSGILFSSYAGSLVDVYDRLKVTRGATAVQKLSTATIYGLVLVLFLVESARRPGSVNVVLCMVGIVVMGCLEKLSTTCLAVSIEREWPSVISSGSSTKLATMNTWLRRTDLVCDLLSPLFVSGLAAGVGYPPAGAVLAGMTVLCFALEVMLSGFAYRQFPELGNPREVHAPEEATNTDQASLLEAGRRPTNIWARATNAPVGLYNIVKAFVHDLLEFSRLPVFWTSLSIASIYLTVLSFDGTMLTYLKNTLNYSDPFLAGQRAACTVAGLLGTVLFPFLLNHIGLVRTGSWSIWFEFACLVPVIVALQLVKTSGGQDSIPPGLATALFGGMALSRIGLWTFDLSQLQILQESLESHPRRNRLTSIQFTLQNMFDMGRYALTMGLAKPAQFRWAGLVSGIAVFAGGTLYVLGYARRVRGHIAPHWRWLAKIKVI